MLARWMELTDEPYLAAMPERVSPFFTVWRTVVGGFGLGGCGLGLGLAAVTTCGFGLAAEVTTTGDLLAADGSGTDWGGGCSAAAILGSSGNGSGLEGFEGLAGEPWFQREGVSAQSSM